MIRARTLNRGAAVGPILVLSEPLSFWGGFDPKTGKVIDTHHPQHGLSLTGQVVLMTEARGSGTAPGAIAEAIRRGTAPAAIVLVAPDVNLAIGASVADALYGRACSVVAVTLEDFALLSKADSLTISASGLIAMTSP